MLLSSLRVFSSVLSCHLVSAADIPVVAHCVRNVSERKGEGILFSTNIVLTMLWVLPNNL